MACPRLLRHFWNVWLPSGSQNVVEWRAGKLIQTNEKRVLARGPQSAGAFSKLPRFAAAWFAQDDDSAFSENVVPRESRLAPNSCRCVAPDCFSLRIRTRIQLAKPPIKIDVATSVQHPRRDSLGFRPAFRRTILAWNARLFPSSVRSRYRVSKASASLWRPVSRTQVSHRRSKIDSLAALENRPVGGVEARDVVHTSEAGQIAILWQAHIRSRLRAFVGVGANRLPETARGSPLGGNP